MDPWQGYCVEDAKCQGDEEECHLVDFKLRSTCQKTINVQGGRSGLDENRSGELLTQKDRVVTARGQRPHASLDTGRQRSGLVTYELVLLRSSSFKRKNLCCGSNVGMKN